MIQTLLKSLRDYKRDSVLSPVLVTCEVVLEVAIPFLMADIIDKGIEKGNMPYIGRMGLLLAVMTLFSLLFGAVSGRYAARAAAGFAKNLRKDMYYNVQNFSFSNIDKFTTASLITRLTIDVSNVQNAYQMIIRQMVRAPVMLLFSMCMTFYVNTQLALVFLFTAPLLGLGLYGIIRRAHPIFVDIFDRYDDLNVVVQENLRGMRVVKSFVREDYENEKFHKRSQEIFRQFVRAEKILALNGPFMQAFIYACILLISWLSAHMIVAGTMTTGELMSVFTYAMQIMFSLMLLSMVFVMTIISRASAGRIAEVLREQPDLHNPPHPVYEVPDGSLEFDNVSFSYAGDRKKFCLREVNLSIASGETVGIIGGTGSAKSTLVHLIPRLYDATVGSVRVGGRDVREYDLQALRDAVSVVLQQNILFSGTIKENLRWGNPNASDEELVHVCKLAQADGFIREFPQQYDTYIEQGGSNVSGGQKQRLCIARALLKKPKILILDDSTSAVDTRTDALIRKALREEVPQTTKIIIAQRIASVQDADKIVVLDGGRVCAVGTHEQLLETSSIYREVYDSQTKGGLANVQ